MSKKDPNHIIKVEKAIAKKYGEEAIKNPKSHWTEEKEKEYLKQIKELAEKEKRKKEFKEKVEKDGFFLPKNLINKNSKRKCSTCGIYSFDMKDDLYINKYECCFGCYIQYVEGREERWQKGWRPDNDKKEQKKN
jgi:phage FluMu gp28-like protein